jgi:hypothetical protein
VNNNEKGDSISLEGSSLGKFKDVKSLLESYNNLQSEFTRKSQRLSALEKSENSKLNSLSDSLPETKTDTINSDIVLDSAMQSNEMQSDSIANNKENSSEPQYLSDTWRLKVANFLETNKNAKFFAYDIAKELASDKALANMPRSLEFAYAKVLAKNYKSEQELVNDSNFIEKHILTNDKIKQKIINNYVLSMQNNISPMLITNASGSGLVGLTPQNKPQSLEEAKVIMERMLKQK